MKLVLLGLLVILPGIALLEPTYDEGCQNNQAWLVHMGVCSNVAAAQAWVKCFGGNQGLAASLQRGDLLTRAGDPLWRTSRRPRRALFSATTLRALAANW